MGNDSKLQKVSLGPEWIDLSFGEPKVVTNCLMRTLNRVDSKFQMPTFWDIPKWEYQPAAGNPDLISLLEKKYDARVVVSNGAKQALAAALFAFKQSGVRSIYYPRPFYPANPSIAKSVGLSWAEIDKADGNLVTSPNNPDGKNLSNTELVSFLYRGPLIHDAAYYTPTYLPENQVPIPVGHIQIYSMSKMYGVSGLRVGYAVCHSEKYYQDMVDYMEETTAGVSTASQQVALEIEKFFRDNKSALGEFEQSGKTEIQKSRKELENLDPEVLQVLPAECDSMFAWCITGSKLDFQSAKVYMLEGTLFGKPGMMRLNIAHPAPVIAEAVSRLNQHKIRN